MEGKALTNAEETVLWLDRTSTRIKEIKLRWLLSDTRPEACLPEIRKQVVSPVLVEVALTSEHSEACLDKYRHALEAEVQRRLATHSRLFLTHVARRLMPTKAVSDNPYVWSNGLYAHSRACLRYGLPDADEFELIPGPDDDSMQAPICIEESALLDLEESFMLTLEAIRVETALRCVLKGARVTFDAERNWQLLPNQRLESSIGLLTARQKSYDRHFGADGWYIGFELAKAQETEALYLLQPNWDEVPLPADLQVALGIRAMQEGMSTNYVPIRCEGSAIHRALASLPNVQVEGRSIAGPELAQVLCALPTGILNTFSGSPLRTHQLLQRAYMRFLSKESLLDFWGQACVCASSDSRDHAEWKTLCTIALPLILYSEDELTELSVTDFGLSKSCFPSGETLLLDYGAYGFTLKSLLRTLAREGDAGNVRGTAFEESTATLVGAAVEGATLWWRNRVLENDAGKKKEVDVSYVIGTTLVIVECKSKITTAAYDRGDRNAIERRTDEVIVQKLRQADELAEFLTDAPVGRNYSVPEKIKRVLPISCSPLVEYIDASVEDHMLTDRIPRACTPLELVQLMRLIAAGRLIEHPAVRELGR